MHDLVWLISHHGYWLLAAVCFAEAIGLPVPAALAILTAGAVSAYGKLHLYFVLPFAVAATLSGDCILFFAGRASGWALLGFLCRLSANPETCILRSAEYFYHRGKLTLLFAKFIPGINTMSPPLAGSMRMRPTQFLAFDSLGAAIYISTYSIAGYVFSDVLRDITRRLRTAGSAAETVFGIGLAVYIVYRIVIYRKYRLLDTAPRVRAEDVGKRLAGATPGSILIADVRSHGYYDADAERIAGSVRLEPNRIEDEVKGLSKEREIYLYCT